MDITTAADVGVGTFYLHFRDKDTLLTELLREGFKHVRNQVRDAVAGRPHAPLAALLRAVLEVAFVERDLFIIAQGYGNPLPGRPAQTALINALARVLDQAAAEGELAGRDPELLAALLSGLVDQAVKWWVDHNEPGPAAMADEVLRLIAGGLPPSLVSEEVQP